MSKQANPFTIGIFVIGAVVLLVAGLIVFGSGSYFQKRTLGIMYFDGSVNGLKVGAPVALRGVQIGQVTNIKLRASQENLTFRIPVTFELDPASIQQIDPQHLELHEYVDALIHKGLRGQLQSQSMVTGLLFINLDFYPDTPARFVSTDSPLPQIPTIPSKLEEISKSLESLPIRETLNQLNETVVAINKIIDTDQARAVVPKLDGALDEAHSVLAHADDILTVVQNHIGPTAQSVESAAHAAAGASKAAENVLTDAQSLVSEDSEFRFRASELLKNLSTTLSSVRTFFDYMDRDPNSVIFGKQAEEKPAR
ncbi:MAG: MCE family protein [Deltaproteobacteria bacterium]|nr:MCE family protein [Deltaproteobacteria bacterium]